MRKLLSLLLSVSLLLAPLSVGAQTNYTQFYTTSVSQDFTSSSTWSLPTGWTQARLEVWIQGGGGGGGSGHSDALDGDHNGGQGASSGELLHVFYTVTGSQTVTINAHGVGGTGGNNGTDSGTTVFGSYTALGGKGNGSQILHTGVTVTNKADWYSYWGCIGLAGGAGNAGSGAGNAGISIPGFFPGGAGGIANPYGSGGGGGSSQFGQGGAGAAGNGGSATNGSVGGLGAGGGGGNGVSGVTRSVGGDGGGGYVLVIATKMS